MGGVREALDRQYGDFVSMARLLQKMVATDGSSVEEAANLLSTLLTQAGEESRPQWVQGKTGQGILPVTGEGKNTVRTALFDVMQYRHSWSMLENTRLGYQFGFRPSEIYPFLRQHGIELAGSEELQVPDYPKWVPFIGRRRISVSLAAGILSGVPNPDCPDYHDDEITMEVDRWEETLRDAIRAGEIEAASMDDTFSHADIRAWCVRRGLVWPVPGLEPQPVTHREALAEIGRLRAGNERLKAELAMARKALSMVDDEHWPEELDDCLMIWRAASLRWEKSAVRPPKAVVEEVTDELFPGYRCGQEKALFSRV